MKRALAALLAGALIASPLAPTAGAAITAAGIQHGRATQAATVAHTTHKSGGGSSLCSTFDVIVTIGISCGVDQLVDTGANAAGSLLSSAGSSILDAVATWVITAATTITGFIAKEMAATSTPQLTSSWYTAQFAPMAALGGGLALLVTMIALASAALRRNAEELARTVTGIVRAGLGTAVVVALTMIALRIADGISSQILANSQTAFWTELAKAWGHSQFAGFGSSMLAALIALLEVLGALAVWLELIVRNGVIYIAVLFFPVALAAAIWRPLSGWPGRLAKVLFLAIILKPVALIVLSLAGNAAAAGISGSQGLSTSIGTILAGVVIFALAAFAPWTLMFLLAADTETAWQANALRMGLPSTKEMGSSARGAAGSAAGAVGGGIASLRSRFSGGSSGGSGGGGSRGGRGGGGGGNSSGGSQRGGGSGGGGGGSRPRLGGAAPSASSAGGAQGAVAAGAVSGGALAVAAGSKGGADAFGQRAAHGAEAAGAFGGGNGGGRGGDKARSGQGGARPGDRTATKPASGGRPPRAAGRPASASPQGRSVTPRRPKSA